MRKASIYLSGALAAAWATSLWAADLPITRVNLFSSGVGYFQRDGMIEGEAAVELQFSVEQMNDILKSMVLQDFDGGTISAVNYPNQEPVEKALRAFAIKIGDNPNLGELLDRCRGSRVQVGGTATVTGTILGVERRQVIKDDQVFTETYLNLMTDDGLRQLDLSAVREVQLLDPRLNAELSAALGVLSRNLDSEKKTVVVEFKGTDRRRVRVGYLLETPIWQTSYRLVLAEEGEPYMQGWANVVNTTDDDWKNVRLALISGRPISFIQDLYTPLYVPRPEVKPELYTSLKPQVYGEGRQKARSPARRAGRARGAAPAAESAEAMYMGEALGAPAEVDAVALRLDLMRAGVTSLAQAADAGELFRYDIETPVTLERQKSAMLPIVGTKIEAEKLSIYNPAVHAKYPLNGLMLTNSTGLHMMQGPITVFDDNTYAGDARLPDLKPGEKRLLSYALDLGVAVDVDRKPHPVRTTSVKIAKGTMIRVQKSIDHRVYNIANKLDRERTVMVEQPMADDWKLIEPPQEEEKADNLYRFRTTVPARETTPFTVRFERTDSYSYALTNMNLGDIRIYVRNSEISRRVRDALQRVIELRTELDRLRRQLRDKETRIGQIDAEQRRIRENMKGLSPSSDLHNRYVKKLDAQETEIENLREEIAELQAQVRRQEQELENYLLSLDVE